jgi:predicted AlkP superfamily pyrophosphatase or phosphodiesterase
MRRPALRVFIWLLLVLSLAPREAVASPPSLVLLLIGDQFRYDYLTRFRQSYSGGIRYLLDHGAVFTDAHIGHAQTETAPGHASLVTGAHPARHGIVANAWYDRKVGRRVSAVEDARHRILGKPEESGGASPGQLGVLTLGDQLRLDTGFRSRVFAIAHKDRSAVLSGGRLATAAYWWDIDTGWMVTSEYYMKEYPGWVSAFNERRLPQRFFGTSWTPRGPPDLHQSLLKMDAFSKDFSGLGRAFPHPLTGNLTAPGPKFHEALLATPFANDLLLEFTKAAIAGEGLGKGPGPDLLIVSFSAIDLVGHVFGPDSPELLDTILRLDQQLADLIAFLGERVDLSRVLFVFTSDHGVAPIPETLGQRGSGGRIGESLRQAVEEGLERRFGPGKWIEAWLPPQVYLNRELARARRVDPTRLEREASALALSHPGVARVYTHRQLEGGRPGQEDPWFIRFARGFDPERSGDLHILVKPFWLFSLGKGTSHGSPYGYDTHVPLILSGPGIRPGVYHQPAEIVDLAPTLAVLLGMEFPTWRDGRVLAKALTGLPFQDNQ